MYDIVLPHFKLIRLFGLKKVLLWSELGLNIMDFWVRTGSEMTHYWSDSYNGSPVKLIEG